MESYGMRKYTVWTKRVISVLNLAGACTKPQGFKRLSRVDDLGKSSVQLDVRGLYLGFGTCPDCKSNCGIRYVEWGFLCLCTIV
jgi:hypothetical protein